MNFNEIEFRSNINNQTDNNKFFINFLHTWSWWEIISYFLDFKFICSLSFIQGWLLFIKGVTYVKSLYFHSLYVFNSESLCTWENQSSDKEKIIIYYLFTFCSRVWLVIQQRLWFLTFTPGVCTTGGWLFVDRFYM